MLPDLAERDFLHREPLILGVSVDWNDLMQEWIREPGDRPRWAIGAAVIAVLFGAITIVSSGTVLFGGSAARAAVGNAVPFVLWFNFAAGFAYILAGVGLFSWRRWAAMLSAVIAFATLSIFVAFGWHAFTGGAFEMRTVGAMAFRSVTWIVIAFASWRSLGRATSKSTKQ